MKSRLFDRKKISSLPLEERISALADNFSMKSETLEHFTTPWQDEKMRILEGLTTLYTHLRSNRYDKHFALSHLTTGVVAAMFYANDNLRNSEKSASRQLKNLFEEDAPKNLGKC